MVTLIVLASSFQETIITAIFSKKYNAEVRTNIAQYRGDIHEYRGDIALMNIARYC